MSAQRAGFGGRTGRRPIDVTMPDLPWWAAIAVAGGATLLGMASDAILGHKDLTGVFAALYVLGCLGAVAAVRRSGVFTAVIQPPLILFFAVPGAYWLFREVRLTDVKGVLINCGYPLIERFPLMFFTSAAVLLVGLGRWYFGAMPGTAEEPGGASATAQWAAATIDKLLTKLNTVLGQVAHATGSRSGSRVSAGRSARGAAGADGSTRRAAARPRRSGASTDRPGRTGSGAARTRRRRPQPGNTAELRTDPTRRRAPAPARGEPPPTRARRARPPADDSVGLGEQRGKPRRRAAPGRGDTPPTRGGSTRRSGYDVPDAAEHAPRRRARPQQEPGRDARERRPRPDRHGTRGDRLDGYRFADPPDAARRSRRDTAAGYGADSGHHPISRARYRRAGSGDDDAAPMRPRRVRAEDAESRRQDI